MKLSLKLKLFCPLKSLERKELEINSVVKYFLDIRVEGLCIILAKDGILDLSADLNLRPLSAWIPDGVLSFGKKSISDIFFNKILSPLREKQILHSYELKLDSKVLEP